MKARRKARETALSELYQSEMSGGGVANAPAGDEASENPYAGELIDGVKEHLEEIDSIIAEKSENWSLPRMAAIDRNLLRIAVFELLYKTDVPFKVVIDEAVTIVKKFGSEDSGAFINAILDRVALKVRSDKAAS